MPIALNFITLFLVFSFAYLIIGVGLFLRRVSTSRLVLWGLAFLTGSAAWQWSTTWSSAAGEPISTLTMVLLVVTAYLLLRTTAEYLEQPVPRWVHLTAGGTVLLTIVLNLVFPNPFLTAASFVRLPFQLGHLLALMVVIVLDVVGYTWVKNGARRTPFPWHANRYLYWSNVILLALVGELLWLGGSPWLALAGSIVRLLAAIGLAYGVATYVRFDVRTRFRRALTQLLLFGLALLPAAALYFLIQQIVPAYPAAVAAVLAVSAIGLVLMLFAPSYRFLERLIYRHLIGEAFKESVVLRNYSQAIAGALEIESLAAAVFDQLNDLFGVSRGAVVLATLIDDDYIFEPIPAAGELVREPYTFAKASPFVALLQRSGQPILQYEIDYNPIYAPVRQAAQGWLMTLEMELYAPIRSGSELKGFIALGPKRSGYTYRANELELIQLFADQTTGALDNATLYRELADQNEKVRHLNENLLRQNQRLETMDQVKSDFITIASHELRTPLTQVKGYTDILASLNEENALTREQARQIINQIERATENLEQLITAMLDASQIDVDEMIMNLVDTKIRSALRLAQEPLSQAMKQRRIRLQINVPDDLPSIKADFKRLVQAFTNILGNSVKYTPDNGRITIDCHLLEKPAVEPESVVKQFVEISITDTGIGIDPAYHQLIFEKFFRLGDPHLHSTGTTKFMGAGPGLGLTIARGVIEGHGGRIWVESAGEDRDRLPGSTFSIILPVNPQDEKETAKPENPVAEAHTPEAKVDSWPEPLADL